MPTASAVIGDIISIVNTARGGYIRNCVCYKELGFYPSDEVVSRFYLRLHVVDEPGVLATIAGIFGEQGVSIQSMQQIGGDEAAQLVLVVHPVRRRRSSARSRESAPCPCCAARRRDQGGGQTMRGRGVIEHYRAYLPVSEATPSSRWARGHAARPGAASRRSARLEVYLKYEGLNPTASFKDRGMTMAITKVVEEGDRRSSAPRRATRAPRRRRTRRRPASGRSC